MIINGSICTIITSKLCDFLCRNKKYSKLLVYMIWNMDDNNTVYGKQYEISKKAYIHVIHLCRHLNDLSDMDIIKYNNNLKMINPDYALHNAENYGHLRSIYDTFHECRKSKKRIYTKSDFINDTSGWQEYINSHKVK